VAACQAKGLSPDTPVAGEGWLLLEKCVIRAPLPGKRKPVHFPSHTMLDVIGRRLVGLERATSWLELPGLALAAFGG
jgi:hypothetical protein